MPRLTTKLFCAKAKPTKAQAGKKRSLVRRVAPGALLAMTLATAQIDGEDATKHFRLFDPGLLDRLRAPLTRFRD
jgi:hypothetical protein